MLITKASDETSAYNITKSENDEKVTIDIVKEEKTIANDNSQVVEDKEKSTQKIKRSDYERSKMKISKAKKTLLLKGNKKQTKKEHCYNKQQYTAKSSVPKEEVKKENEGEKSGLTQKKVLQKQVEDMIRQGKKDAESKARIETLKGPEVSLKEDENIHKIDKNKDKTKDKLIISSKEGTEISIQNKDTINVIKKDEKVILKVEVESSDEFNSDNSVTKEVDSIIMNLDNSKGEQEKTVKQVTFAETVQTVQSACIDTMAQLDDTFGRVDGGRVGWVG